MTQKYDAAVVGAGLAGLAAARDLARGGADVGVGRPSGRDPPAVVCGLPVGPLRDVSITGVSDERWRVGDEALEPSSGASASEASTPSPRAT